MNYLRMLILLIAAGFAGSCSKGLFNQERETHGKKGHFSDFTSIKPSKEDRVILPGGYKSNIIISYGDPINDSGDTFGFNNDHIEFFPEDIQNEKKNEEIRSGFLFVNHEYFPPKPSPKTRKTVYQEKYAVGATIIKINMNEKGMWVIDKNYAGNRRYTAMSRMRMDGPVQKILGNYVTGTMDNCSGGKTPWGTVLSGEESTDYGTARGWPDFEPKATGWIVEFDPYDKNHIPVKHSSLGRFKHENVAVTISKSGRAVVYMGEDRVAGGFYKFISDGKFNPASRKHNFNLLASGRLFGAHMEDASQKAGKGKWIPIDINDAKSGLILAQNGFETQEDVLLDIARASKLLDVTGLDRPEDCEVHPLEGSIYCALTNDARKIPPNLHGMIMKFTEKNGDHESGIFTYETFAEGGEEAGFSSPDNLAFDSLGNLWMTTDVYSPSLNKLNWEFNGNNSILMFKTEGPDKGRGYRFASAPSGSEFTGPWFSEDERVLFLSVQHPGEGGNPSSWPDGEAKPSVIAVYKN